MIRKQHQTAFCIKTYIFKDIFEHIHRWHVVYIVTSSPNEILYKVFSEMIIWHLCGWYFYIQSWKSFYIFKKLKAQVETELNKIFRILLPEKKYSFVFSVYYILHNKMVFLSGTIKYYWNGKKIYHTNFWSKL